MCLCLGTCNCKPQNLESGRLISLYKPSQKIDRKHAKHLRQIDFVSFNPVEKVEAHIQNLILTFGPDVVKIGVYLALTETELNNMKATQSDTNTTVE